MRLRAIEPPLCVIGAPQDALDLLVEVLSGLPRKLGAVVAVATHEPRGIERLVRACALEVAEAEDRSPLAPSRVHVAPPDYHLLVDGGRFALSTEGSVQGARPSIDVLFESAAERRGGPVLGVLLAGAGDDGAQGLDALHHAGATTIATPTLDRARTRHEPTHVVPSARVAALLVAFAGTGIDSTPR